MTPALSVAETDRVVVDPHADPVQGEGFRLRNKFQSEMGPRAAKSRDDAKPLA